MFCCWRAGINGLQARMGLRSRVLRGNVWHIVPGQAAPENQTRRPTPARGSVVSPWLVPRGAMGAAGCHGVSVSLARAPLGSGQRRLGSESVRSPEHSRMCSFVLQKIWWSRHPRNGWRSHGCCLRPRLERLHLEGPGSEASLLMRHSSVRPPLSAPLTEGSPGARGSLRASMSPASSEPVPRGSIHHHFHPQPSWPLAPGCRGRDLSTTSPPRVLPGGTGLKGRRLTTHVI